MGKKSVQENIDKEMKDIIMPGIDKDKDVAAGIYLVLCHQLNGLGWCFAITSIT